MKRRSWMHAGGALMLGGVIPSTEAMSAHPRIAVLTGTGVTSDRLTLGRLGELGWQDGRNATLIVRRGHSHEMPALAAELAAQRPDIVIAAFDYAIKAAMQAIPTVPIVMAGTLDPVGFGWVQSLRRPGGRVTGTAWSQDPAMMAKYVEILIEVVPGLRRLGGLIDPTFLGIDRYRVEMDAVARRRGIDATHVSLTGIDGLSAAVDALVAARVQGVMVYGAPTVAAHGGRVAAALASARIPAIFILRHVAEAGGLISYGPSIAEITRRAVDIADRILRGADPAVTPVEQPARYETVVNLRTAAAMGLRMPASVLARADDVIE